MLYRNLLDSFIDDERTLVGWCEAKGYEQREIDAAIGWIRRIKRDLFENTMEGQYVAVVHYYDAALSGNRGELSNNAMTIIRVWAEMNGLKHDIRSNHSTVAVDELPSDY